MKREQQSKQNYGRVISVLVIIAALVWGMNYWIRNLPDLEVSVTENENANTNSVIHENANTNSENANENANTNSSTNATNENTNTESTEYVYATVTEGEVWNTYENFIWGFSFQYPAGWEITRDTLADPESEDSNNGTGALFVGVPLEDGRSVPSINLWADPDGFGPFFPNAEYTIKKIGEGFTVTSEEELGDENQDPDLYQIIASEPSDTRSPRFVIHFNQSDDGSATWDETVKEMLASFRFEY